MKRHTLAKKFEAVHNTTTTSNKAIPRDRLAVAPSRPPLAFDEMPGVFMSPSVSWSICDSLYNNGACCDGEAVVGSAISCRRLQAGGAEGLRGVRWADKSTR